VAVLAIAPPRAHAFSSPETYDLPAVEAGGGGRFFTGTPADGFGCDVCHEGGTPAPLQITGLPVGGYEPGASYEITIAWPLSIEHVAMLAEITDASSRKAGTITLPRPDSMTPDELCAAEEGGFPPGWVYDTEDMARAIVGNVDCGSKKLRFRWTAPISARSPLWFGAGLVHSNDDADASGDGVTQVRVPLLARRGSLGTYAVATSACSAALPHAAGASARATPPALLIPALSALVLVARRRPARNPARSRDR
jgi:hypothetical protein